MDSPWLSVRPSAPQCHTGKALTGGGEEENLMHVKELREKCRE